MLRLMGAVRPVMPRGVDTGRVNNFDLLRLFAASQVALSHAVLYLDVRLEGAGAALMELFSYFPGVPIFFVISGFLISMSLERCPSLTHYGVSRVLRIYPALWVCLGVTLAVLTVVGYWEQVVVSPGALVPWIASELAFGHVYSSAIFGGYGMGKLNPVLWTIPVELQFYLALPVIFALFRRIGVRALYVWTLALVGVSAAAGHLLMSHTVPMHDPITADTFLLKVFEKTLIPYLYMFLMGVFIQQHFHRLRCVLEGKAMGWLAVYVLACVLCRRFTDLQVGSNFPNFALFVLLAMTVISSAYTARSLATHLLRGNDISYGIYVYHMVVVNTLIELDYSTGWRALIVTFAATYVLAILSWRFVERHALALKSRVPQLRRLFATKEK